MNENGPSGKADTRGSKGNRGRGGQLSGSLRQLLQPEAFRIASPEQGADVFLQGDSNHDRSAAAVESSNNREELSEALKTLAATATAIWRVRSKFETGINAELPSELRHIPRHIQAAWDALAAGHIEVRDLTGERYVPGMAVNILAFQPLEGISSEIIHETIKPSIYFNDTLIQYADVIIARPMRDSESGAEHASTAEDRTSEEKHCPSSKGEDLDASNDD